MKFYLNINGENELYEVKSFNESVQQGVHFLSLSFKLGPDEAERRNLISYLSQFLASRTIDNVQIVNDKEEIVYVQSVNKFLDSFNVSLNNSVTGAEDPITYTAKIDL